VTQLTHKSQRFRTGSIRSIVKNPDLNTDPDPGLELFRCRIQIRMINFSDAGSRINSFGSTTLFFKYRHHISHYPVPLNVSMSRDLQKMMVRTRATSFSSPCRIAGPILSGPDATVMRKFLIFLLVFSTVICMSCKSS
jgi:hypothetical protein